MIAYVDSSVVLRFVLEQPEQLTELAHYPQLVTSTLTQSECLRTVDNLCIIGTIPEGDYPARRYSVFSKLHGVQQVSPSSSVLATTSGTFPAAIATLDAIHVATALQWRDRREPDLVFATHDKQQSKVARLLGFEVIGV